MNVLVTTLVGVMAAAASLAGQGSAQPTDWITFVGYWRMDPSFTDRSPMVPFLMHIAVEGEELTIVRRTFNSTETSRYRLDGGPARTVEYGQPADATAAIEGEKLVIKARLTLAGGRTSTVTDVYSVRRRIMTIDRTTTRGNRTTTENEFLRRLPTPRPNR